MSCPTEGVLRTVLDGEVRGSELEAAEKHIGGCERCGLRLRSIEAQRSGVQENLAALQNESSTADARFAYQRFQQAAAGRAVRRPPMVWPRPAIGWAAAAVVVLLVLALSPGRTWAQRVLSMLRVQKVAVLPVDLSELTAQNALGHGGLIAQFMSDNVVITMQPAKPAAAADVAAAGQAAGFAVRTLDQLGTPGKISVNDQGAFQMTLNRERLQALVDAAGRSDIQIPASADGSLLAVHVPKMVLLQYGNCGKAADTQNCINFMQVPSPTISVPPSLNLAALAESALQLAGMGAAEAHTFAQNVDWTSTLVIPLPQAGASFRTVPVDGVNGSLIESAPRGNFVGHYQLIWVKNGIVYSLGGQGTSERALAAAESLS